MAHEIIKRTIGGVDDQRSVVDNLHPPLVRKMIIGSDWTKIRVVLRISSNRTSSYSSPPSMYFGLCAGTTSPPGSVTPNHFFGVRSNSSQWLYRTGWGSPYCIQIGMNSSLITNGSETTASLGLSGDYYQMPTFSIATTGASLFGIEIEKGTPYTLRMWSLNGHSAYSSKRVATMDDFVYMINASSPPTGYEDNSTTAYTPDESTYGDLDTVCFAFLSTTDAFEVSDIDYARLA